MDPLEECDATDRPSSSFVVNFGAEREDSAASLQDAFIQYKLKKQNEIRKARSREAPDELRLRAMADPERMWSLRIKFLNQAKKYFGVPYAKKYWSEQDSEFQSKIFLDCCGLVRRCLKDLRADFGFKIGPWNQGYMYDTLPVSLTEEQMKPGDLVFISATYFNSKMKKQPHQMTHVEIWLGDGPKTIGSRWNKGHVQVFDSYAFKAKSYHTPTYHFKSIDTWLMGICRSFCKEHPWLTRAEKVKLSKKSIFLLGDDDKAGATATRSNAAMDCDEKSTKKARQRKKSPTVKKSTQHVEVVEIKGGVMPSAFASAARGPVNRREVDTHEDSEANFNEEDEEEDNTQHDVEQDEQQDEEEQEEEEAASQMGEEADDTSKSGTASAKSSASEIIGEGELRDPRQLEIPASLRSVHVNYPIKTSHLQEKLIDDILKLTWSGEKNDESEKLSSSDFWVESRTELDKNISCDSNVCDEKTVETSSDAAEFLDDRRENFAGGARNKTNEQKKSNSDVEDHKQTTKEGQITGVTPPKAEPSEKTAQPTNEAEQLDRTVKPLKAKVKELPQQTEEAPKDAQHHVTPDTQHPTSKTPEKFEPKHKNRREERANEKSPSPKPLHRNKTHGTVRGAKRDNIFYIGGRNGVALIEEVLTGMKWKQTTDKLDNSWKLKWVECKSHIDYQAFQEGEQLVNHIPNCQLLTNKMGLLNSLEAYDRVCRLVLGKEPKLKLHDFIPKTYRLDDFKERQVFYEAFKDGEIWICKPTGLNQGRGIFLIRDLDEFKRAQKLKEEEDNKRPYRKLEGRIVQRYVLNPLLMDSRKFDIRAYMLVACTAPYLVLYHKGYVRLAVINYDNNCLDLTAHLTNQFIQKKSSQYEEKKETTAWSMDKFNQYINENVAASKRLAPDWVYLVLTPRMKQIMLHCFRTVQNKLSCKVGYFDLYGFDFLVDENMKIWLIEINVNPCLAVNCEALRDVIPGVVRETIEISVECFEKSRKNQPLLPLQSLKNFKILHSPKSSSAGRCTTAVSRWARASGGRRTPRPVTSVSLTDSERSKIQHDLKTVLPKSPYRCTPTHVTPVTIQARSSNPTSIHSLMRKLWNQETEADRIKSKHQMRTRLFQIYSFPSSRTTESVRMQAQGPRHSSPSPVRDATDLRLSPRPAHPEQASVRITLPEILPADSEHSELRE